MELNNVLCLESNYYTQNKIKLSKWLIFSLLNGFGKDIQVEKFIDINQYNFIL